MLLVGSLVFFLLAVFYSGRFEIRLHWIMFWFVFASVLIARIAIEHGSESAGLYGLLLAIAHCFGHFSVRRCSRRRVDSIGGDLVVYQQTDLGQHADRRQRRFLGRGSIASQ